MNWNRFSRHPLPDGVRHGLAANYRRFDPRTGLRRGIFAGEKDVREALLDRLNIDSNPGVRVEAVNLLVRSLELESVHQAPEAPDSPDSPDFDIPMVAPVAALPATDPSVQRVVRALEDLQRHDPNRYVRLRSAAALRQIGPSEVQ